MMNRTYSQTLRRLLSLATAAPAIVVVVSACQPGRNFYVLEEIRVPAMQVLQKVDAAVEGKHCFSFSGETVCQQYPLRPGQKFHFRMLALAPGGSQPIKIKFTKLKRSKLTVPFDQLNSTSVSCDALLTEVDVPLNTLGLPDDFLQSSVKQETPMRVEEQSVSFTLPEKSVFDSELLSSSLLPLYRIEYEATSGSLRTDKGSLTFPVFAEAQSTGSNPPNSGTSSNASGCLGAVLGSLSTASSNTNTPAVAPSIASVTPAMNEVVAGSPLNLQMNLTQTATSSTARRRIQWYITRGELENQRAASTELKFSGSEPLTAVGIVRDLQGGVDFAWTTFTAKQ